MLRQIIDIGDTNYFMTRAVEYIREAKMIRAGELHGSRTESERRDDWRQRISMAITLLAIAAEKTDASS